MYPSAVIFIYLEEHTLIDTYTQVPIFFQNENPNNLKVGIQYLVHFFFFVFIFSWSPALIASKAVSLFAQFYKVVLINTAESSGQK